MGLGARGQRDSRGEVTRLSSTRVLWDQGNSELLITDVEVISRGKVSLLLSGENDGEPLDCQSPVEKRPGAVLRAAVLLLVPFLGGDGDFPDQTVIIGVDLGDSSQLPDIIDGVLVLDQDDIIWPEVSLCVSPLGSDDV